MHVQSCCFAELKLLTFDVAVALVVGNLVPRFSWERGCLRRSFLRSLKRV